MNKYKNEKKKNVKKLIVTKTVANMYLNKKILKLQF